MYCCILYSYEHVNNICVPRQQRKQTHTNKSPSETSSWFLPPPGGTGQTGPGAPALSTGPSSCGRQLHLEPHDCCCCCRQSHDDDVVGTTTFLSPPQRKLSPSDRRCQHRKTMLPSTCVPAGRSPLVRFEDGPPCRAHQHWSSTCTDVPGTAIRVQPSQHAAEPMNSVHRWNSRRGINKKLAFEVREHGPGIATPRPSPYTHNCLDVGMIVCR